MTNLELSDREKFVLSSIVESFVTSASPVGSKRVARQYNGGISSATIRNVMMDLEKRGLISQPYPSAGRVPTNMGYRMYVDALMKVEDLTLRDKNKIFRNFSEVSLDAEYILEAASYTLAKISNLLGMVLAPRFYEGILNKIELIPIAETKILVIISIQSGLVKSITLEIDNHIRPEKLESMARILNERLHGLTLKEIKTTIDERLKEINVEEVPFIDHFLKSSNSIFNFSSPFDVHVGGAKNLMSQPEFANQSYLNQFMGLIDDRGVLIHVMNDGYEETGSHSGKIRITIGEENRRDLIHHCSLITASYKVGDISGTLGVLGPTRMQYSKLVALVDYMAEVLGYILGPSRN